MDKPGANKSNKNNNNEYYNLLFLGPTGVGKSTFINAFANYLMYDTLEAAKGAYPLVLIKSKFLVTDESFVGKVKSVGAETSTSDESDVLGDSATQETRTYTFSLLIKKKMLRLIDTPGIGDTRGIDQVELNCDDIFQKISQYDQIHAICFFLKPKDARVTAEFEFCVKELLSRLDKSATDNIIFIFTHSRASLYTPGDTLPALQRLLQNVKEQPPHVDIPLRKENIFCMDNEAFRFLMATGKVKFDDEAVAEFERSWNVSREVCRRLVNYIMGDENNPGLKPHVTKSTISINNVRRLIMGLAHLLADISKLICDNRYAVEQQVKRLEKEKQNLNELKNNMFTTNVYVAFEIANREADIKISEIKVQQMAILIKEHEEEYETILNSLSIYAWFLKNNAITPYNDAYHTYVSYLIVRETFQGDKADRFTINHFQTVLRRYEEYKKILNGTSALSEATVVNAAIVTDLTHKLFSLKHNGIKIKYLYQGQSRGHDVESINFEYVHPTTLSLNAETSAPQTNSKSYMPSLRTPQTGQEQNQFKNNQPKNSPIKQRCQEPPRHRRKKCDYPLENKNQLPPPHFQLLPLPYFQRSKRLPPPNFQEPPELFRAPPPPFRAPPPPFRIPPPPYRIPPPHFRAPPAHFQTPPPQFKSLRQYTQQHPVPDYYRNVPSCQNYSPISSSDFPHQNWKNQMRAVCLQNQQQQITQSANQQHAKQLHKPGPSSGNNFSNSAAGADLC